jgi:hypothetical protein
MRLFFVLLFCAYWGVVSAQAPKSPVTVDLAQALQKKLVSIAVEATGGYHGECLKVVCKNLTGRYLRIRIPIGQLMEPRDTAEQTLVVAAEQLLAVNAKTPVEALLQTFCAQSGDLSPARASVFAAGAMAPQKLCDLLRFIVEKGEAGQVEAQNAVWCVTDNSSLGSVNDVELLKYTAQLLGKPLPGYAIKRQTVSHFPGSRAEPGKAMVVEGNFRFVLDKDEKTIMVLLDATGKIIKQLSKEESMKAGEHRSGLHVEVINLDPGHYTVRLQTKGGRVIKDLEVDF